LVLNGFQRNYLVRYEASTTELQKVALLHLLHMHSKCLVLAFKLYFLNIYIYWPKFGFSYGEIGKLEISICINSFPPYRQSLNSSSYWIAELPVLALILVSKFNKSR